ncbi:unnamed protein product, partial [marine sediment metagenome]
MNKVTAMLKVVTASGELVSKLHDFVVDDLEGTMSLDQVKKFMSDNSELIASTEEYAEVLGKKQEKAIDGLSKILKKSSDNVRSTFLILTQDL